MKTHVKALVVGGGAVGTGIAYHLAKAGWDTMLVERDELTAGSTWHAAGLLPLFNMGYATTHIHKYSVDFYKGLEAETGLNPGFYVVGNLRMAQHQQRMDEYMLYSSVAETADVYHEFLTPAQMEDRWPLLRTDDLIGALYHPQDGYINPADVTQAMAKGARQFGCTFERKVQVNGYRWTGAEWIVSCSRMVEQGGNLVAADEFDIHAEHVVTATGNHAQRTARLLGIKTPAVVVEHQYIVTEPDPVLVEWRKTNPQHPVLRDADAKWYVREERGGWILGPYEKNAPARFEYGVPESFRADLFPLDLERIEQEYMSFIHRLPSSETVGLKDDYNGPICYTPDGNPLVGPAPGLRNMWLAEGFSFGITAAGGTGHYLAQLMTQGEAEIDMASLDPRRFAQSWMTTEYAARKNEECYDHVFILHHPDEERPACRPLRTAPVYDRQKALGAQFGQVNGWERPIYYGPTDAPEDFDHDTRSFRRGGWWQYAVDEARAIRETAGLIDATAFTKHIVRGPGATAFLDWFTCNALPKIGRINLTYALTPSGTTRTEYTIVRNGENDYYLVSAGAWTAYDADYLQKSMQDFIAAGGAHVDMHDVTTQWGVFAIAGPNSRKILSDLIKDADPATALSNKRFPWLSARKIELGMCPVNAIRVAYTGELGWELHHPIEMQRYLWDQLLAAGAKHGMKLVGARAQNWLRQEKSYRAFGNELGRDATPLEAGLPRFVDMTKDFQGKAAMVATGIRSMCVTVLIDGPSDTDPWGKEALLVDGVKVGRLTSGGYSVAFGKQIGMGYVRPDLAVVGTKLKVKMLRAEWDAVVVEDSPFDPANARIRVDG